MKRTDFIGISCFFSFFLLWVLGVEQRTKRVPCLSYTLTSRIKALLALNFTNTKPSQIEVTEPAVGGRRLNIPRSLTSLSNAFSSHVVSTRAASGALPDKTARQARYRVSCLGQPRPYR